MVFHSRLFPAARPVLVAALPLCDISRFRQAADPVEWEVFRTSALERQGWNLCRVWSPSIFANSSLHWARIAQSSQRTGKPVNAAKKKGEK
jgi:hypothetical protein